MKTDLERADGYRRHAIELRVAAESHRKRAADMERSAADYERQAVADPKMAFEVGELALSIRSRVDKYKEQAIVRDKEAAEFERKAHEAQGLLSERTERTEPTSVPDSMDRCAPPCGKRRYTSERLALAANRKNHHTMRAYRSNECGCWHITKAETSRRGQWT